MHTNPTLRKKKKRGRKILFFLTIIVFAAILVKNEDFNRVTTAIERKISPIPTQAVKQAMKNHSNDVNNLEAEGVILINQQTGEVLFSKNAQKKMYPASTTKIVTALVALESSYVNDLVTVGDEVLPEVQGESKAGLRSGQQLPMGELIKAMLLPSGNDAARAVAVYIAKQELGEDISDKAAYKYFAKLMNERAKKAGAAKSNFVNPSGLHHNKHYSTAADIAQLAFAAMKNEQFRSIVQLQQASIDVVDVNTKEHSQVNISNTNKLMDNNTDFYYPGTTGLKTGFTDEAGYCLVSSATHNNEQLIAVALHSTVYGIWYDSKTLLDYGFDQTTKGGKKL